MAKVSDIEQLLKTFLVTNGFTSGKIFLQEFPSNSVKDDVFVLRRVGSGDIPAHIAIDVPIVRVWARHTNAHASYLNQKSVGDLLQGLNPVDVGTSKFLFAQMVAGIDRDDDTVRDIPQHVASYEIRVVVP